MRPSEGGLAYLFVKRLMEGEELELEVGGRLQKGWSIIHKALRKGQHLRIRGVGWEKLTVWRRNLLLWRNRNRDKYPILCKMHTAVFDDEEQPVLLVYFSAWED